MTIRTYKPTTSTLRSRKSLVREVDNVKPEKRLMLSNVGPSARSRGRVSMRHQDSGARKMYRIIDYKRDKLNIPATVESIQYDPNRGPNIALLVYADGEKRYILAPEGLKKGIKVLSGGNIEATVGNAIPLKDIPLGMQIHNIELNPKAGAVLVRGAGAYAVLMAKEVGFVNLKMPSGEVKKVSGECYATIGALSNPDLRNVRLGKAGRNRHLGVRPAVRGVAMGNPSKGHPHGGSYKTTGIGMVMPKTPWGKPARGVRTRKRKSTDYSIVKGRHSK